MLDVNAFRGYRFDPQTVGNFDDVITPPFDVIGAEDRDALAARSPYNFTHVILPKPEGETDRYQVAAKCLEDWIAQDALRRDEAESFYLFEQHFEDQEGRPRVRRGFFAVTRIPEPSEKTVLGHEQTFPHKIADRLALTRATRANLSPVFVLYSDPDASLKSFLAQMDQRDADLHATTLDGVEVRTWRVAADPAVTQFFENRKLYIADGHHRFATAVAYRDEMRAGASSAGLQPFDHVMMGFVSFDDPGLLVYPAHRILDMPQQIEFETFRQRLEPFFDIIAVSGDLVAEVAGRNGCTLGMAVRNSGQYLLRLKKDVDRAEFLGIAHGPAWRNLDAAVLHTGIIEGMLGVEPGSELLYEPDAHKALACAEEREHGMAFLMRGPSTAQIQACADAGEFMPQKTTYLFPKLPAGTVIHRLLR